MQGFSTACVGDGINRIAQVPHDSFCVCERLDPPYLLVVVLVFVLFQGDHFEFGCVRAVARRGCYEVQNRPCLFIADDIGAGGDYVGHIGRGMSWELVDVVGCCSPLCGCGACVARSGPAGTLR